MALDAFDIELKWFDTFGQLHDVSNQQDATLGLLVPTGGPWSLASPSRGTGSYQREGKQILLQSIELQGVVWLYGGQDITDLSVANNVPHVYISLVLDKQTNGTLLTSELVYKNVGTASWTAAIPFRNLSYESRFDVLASTIVKPSQFATQTSSGNPTVVNSISLTGVQVPVRLCVNFNDLPVNFTAGSIDADNQYVIDNSIHCMAWTSGSGGLVTFDYGCRVRFLG